MKLHLPVLLRKSVLSCLATVGLYTMGSSVAWADNLTFDGTTLIWNTSEDNKSFADVTDAPAAFAAGDNVSFSGESTVTLGEDISAGTVAIEKGADVTIVLDVFELNVDRIELGGTLDVGDSLSIGKGSTLAMTDAGAVLDSNLVLGEKGVLAVTGAGGSLGGHSLTLQQGASLILTGAVISRETTDADQDGELSLIVTSTGDGKTYTLLTGVDVLVDKTGNALAAGSYAIDDLFDSSLPGSGFWTGGTLVYAADGNLTLIRHNEIVKDALDVTTRQTGSVNYSYYAGISFKNLTITDSDGGAIYGWGSITLNNNGRVEFSGNNASGDNARGGAICGNVSMTGNGSVTFSGNSASSDGGAIYGGIITLNNNGSVKFIGNTASTSSTYTPKGGAICGRSITLNNNGSVEFSGNSAHRTGAIFGYEDCTITLNNNGSVCFSGNTASAYAGAVGGELCNVTLSNNASVSFIENKTAAGGAIFGVTITLNNNGSVLFSGNSASATFSTSYISFFGGGAICTNYYNSPITLSDNGSVTFSGNSSSSVGGAICGEDIELNNNGSVTFSGNKASGSDASGGAIYTSGSLHIRNNDSVEFAGNVEKRGGDYRLRSVYVEGGSGDVLSISAAEGKSVVFYDTIYVGSDATVNLNADYEDAEGNIIEQKGDIVFTGATTVADLYKVKGNVDGTEGEIRLSHTSEVLSMANLYNGRLIIKEGAIWSGAGITVDPVAGATGKPTLMLQNGTLTHDASSVTNRNVVTIKSGGAFEVAGKSQADYTSLVLEGGSSWIFNIGSDNTAADSAVLSMENSSLTLPGSGKVTLQLNAATGVGNGKAYALLSGIEQPTDWSADSITVISGTAGWNVGFSDLIWADNMLWLYYDARPALVTATWTNESGDGKWNTTSVNWEQNEIDFSYKNGVAVVFDGQGAGTVELVGELAPGSVLVNNAAGQDYTFGGSGSLTGDMKLTKKGAGNLTISTANSYTGGTVVNGGKLIAGHNNAFGSGDVTVNNGGTLDLSTYVVPNKVFMNGSSTLANANGASHIVLGGGSQVSFSNGFTLGSGKTLEVATGGATYKGALTLGGGTLELSDQLIVQGDVVFEAGKSTTIDISGWTTAGDGTVLVDFGSANSGYAEDCLTLSGITGDWELDFNTATGVLTLVAVKEDFRPNLDRNQQEVYDTMKDIMAGGNPGGVLGQLGQNIIGTRDEAELKRALDEISGREYATIMSSQIEGNLGHLRRLRASAGRGTPLGEYVRPGESVFSNKGVDKSDNKGATVLMAPSPVLDSRRIRAGVSAFHEQAELDADANGDGFERSETGAQLTMEYLVSNDFVLGMGLSHSRTKLTPAYGKRRDEDNTHVDLYGVYQSGSWSSTTALGVGLHQHELGRTVAGMQTEAEADGLSVNFLQELAYCVYADEEQGLEVFGAVESSFNKVDSFSESGAGNASLLVDEQDAWATDVTLGLRYNHALPSLGKAPAGVFTLQGGVVASLGDTNADATVHFAGAPGYAFKQSAAERNRWGYSVGASVNLPVSASTAVFGTAEAVLRNDSYTVDAQVGVKMAF